MLKDIARMEMSERLARTKVLRGLILYVGGMMAAVLFSALLGGVLSMIVYGMEGMSLMKNAGEMMACLMGSALPVGLLLLAFFVLKKDGVRKGIMRFLLVLAVLVYAGMMVVSFVYVPFESYRGALSYLEEGKAYEAETLDAAVERYEYAVSGFEGLGSYRDSEERCVEAQQHLQYAKALKYMQQESYSWAEDAFAALGDFRDSAQKAEECRAILWQYYYDRAVKELEKNDYIRAYELLRNARGYAPADELLANDPRVQTGREQALEVGQKVRLGEYRRSTRENTWYGVDWIILARDEDRALLLSEVALDRQPWHNTPEMVSWAESSLRAWLNDACLNALFNEEEQTCILPTELEGSTDRLFLLSVEEWEKYADRVEGTCEATLYARGEDSGAVVSYITAWLLRDPALAKRYMTEDLTPTDEGYYIRPAMWVTLDSEIF